MSSRHKQLSRVKEVPVDVSSKLKQHDVITCKVNTTATTTSLGLC